MRIAKFFMIVIIAFLLLSCAAKKEFIRYDTSLTVERPADAKERYGEKKIEEVEEKEVLLKFEDEMISAEWLTLSHGLLLKIKNKTDHSIEIVWDKGAFVDKDGNCHRIVRGDVRRLYANRPQPPSIVVRKTGLSETIIPADSISTEGWNYYILPTLSEKISEVYSSLGPKERNKISEDEVKHKAKEAIQSYVGKTFQILLPLKIEEVINEYIFIFKIDDVNFVVKQEKDRAMGLLLGAGALLAGGIVVLLLL